MCIILFSASSALALVGSCNNQNNFETLVCGGTPNSVSGFGAVEICGNCYPCGQADGICPEDFYSTVTQMQGNCRLCPDPDCPATIKGYVFEKGIEVPNAEIITTYNGQGAIEEVDKINKTNTSGQYTGSIPAGKHKMFIQFGSFKSPTQIVEINRGENKEINFTINRGSCNADCTIGSTGLCSANCNNQEGCVFPENTTIDSSLTSEFIASKCDSLEGGTSILNLGEFNNEVHRITCCTGPYQKTTVIKAQVGASIKSKIKSSSGWNTPVILSDEPLILKVLFGK